MVIYGPDTPPGHDGVRGFRWCAEHELWAKLNPDGKYLCPRGHTVKRKKPAHKDQGGHGRTDGEHN